MKFSHTKTLLASLLAAVLVTGGCADKPGGSGTESRGTGTHPPPATTAAGDQMSDNPLLAVWETPFGVPAFDDFHDSDYLPALREAVRRHAEEVDAIATQAAAPTFANTIEALEASGADLTKVSNVFYALNSAHSNDTIREVARKIAPELSAHRDNISLNRALYERVKTVYDARDSLGLAAEQLRLLEETHKKFVRSGVNLPGDAQTRLREINGELAAMSQQFGQNLLKETNDFELLVTDKTDLGALPDSLLAAAAQEAGRRGHDCECWVFTLQRPSINPFLQYSPNRALREKIYLGYAQRGNNDNEVDNKELLAKMAALRAERAQLMGFQTHAHYVLSDNMSQTPKRVYELLDQVWPAALRVAQEERDALQSLMREDGVDGPMQGWDWRYYTEKLRKSRYDFDAEALRPYFEVSAVRDGAFGVANRLFGLEFRPLADMPKWHGDQEVFEVTEADGSHVGVLYMDFFARESKRGGAWMNALRSQSRQNGDVKPVVTNNFNFPPPTAGAPSLLSYSEAETLFHEFGHALHGLLSDVTYESLSGTSVPRDFVEFPSQVMENWMSEPEVLRMFARHYRTGEPIPEDIVEKIQASSTFNQGFATAEYMAASYLDMAWHTLVQPDEVEPRGFEKALLEKIGLIEEIIPRYRSTYFAHIFSGGYSAGYYSYLWSEVLDADAFEAFRETSLFDADTANRYREHILSKGGTRPGMELYEAFRGRQPVIDPLLERRGLTSGS